jgi:hypothetical protein
VYKKKTKSTNISPSQNYCRRRRATGEACKYIWYLKRAAPLFLRPAGYYSKEILRMESLCKGDDRRFLGSIA